MYALDTTGAQVILTYSEVFQDDLPDLVEEIKKLNVHKAISIICELIRVRDARLEVGETFFGRLDISLETILKKEMCGIDPKSAEEMVSHPLLRKDVHIISVQMLFMLLKRIISFGNLDLQIAIGTGQQGHISRPGRAILNGHFCE